MNVSSNPTNGFQNFLFTFHFTTISLRTRFLHFLKFADRLFLTLRSAAPFILKTARQSSFFYVSLFFLFGDTWTNWDGEGSEEKKEMIHGTYIDMIFFLSPTKTNIIQKSLRMECETGFFLLASACLVKSSRALRKTVAVMVNLRMRRYCQLCNT